MYCGQTIDLYEEQTICSKSPAIWTNSKWPPEQACVVGVLALYFCCRIIQVDARIGSGLGDSLFNDLSAQKTIYKCTELLLLLPQLAKNWLWCVS